uniref:GYF domain-containing protein n=1 Tax=uncultured bacterium W5-77b TaxID=1131000 RepID=H9BWF4_9BACT|nr:hypothetical protein [uncultured bacterium W5-77b]
MLITIIFGLLMGSVTAYFASKRGRTPSLWFAIGVLFGMLGLLALFILPNFAEDKEKSATMAAKDGDAIEVEGKISSLDTTLTADEEIISQNWFYLDDKHKQHDAVSLEALKKIWKEGEISEFTFVWAEGMAQWQKIQDISQLKIHLSS